ncbi:MAG: hypothetical protein J6S84_07745 [Bacteroidales bacterium]|nr:hypothetical protein [Bacteroidales bacterium]
MAFFEIFTNFAKSKIRYMCIATIEYSKNKKEIDTLLSIIKKLGAVVTISKEEPKYNPEIVAKAERGREAYKRGECVKIAIEDLWK